MLCPCDQQLTPLNRQLQEKAKWKSKRRNCRDNWQTRSRFPYDQNLTVITKFLLFQNFCCEERIHHREILQMSLSLTEGRITKILKERKSFSKKTDTSGKQFRNRWSNKDNSQSNNDSSLSSRTTTTSLVNNIFPYRMCSSSTRSNSRCNSSCCVSVFSSRLISSGISSSSEGGGLAGAFFSFCLICGNLSEILMSVAAVVIFLLPLISLLSPISFLPFKLRSPLGISRTFNASDGLRRTDCHWGGRKPTSTKAVYKQNQPIRDYVCKMYLRLSIVTNYCHKRKTSTHSQIIVVNKYCHVFLCLMKELLRAVMFSQAHIFDLTKWQAFTSLIKYWLQWRTR